MKPCSAIGIIALAVDRTGFATAARESITVVEDNISFEIDRYDDGRSKPYRVTFTNPDDGVASTFRWVRGVACSYYRAQEPFFLDTQRVGKGKMKGDTHVKDRKCDR